MDGEGSNRNMGASYKTTAFPFVFFLFLASRYSFLHALAISHHETACQDACAKTVPFKFECFDVTILMHSVHISAFFLDTRFVVV
jgi:hypothetical protein